MAAEGQEDASLRRINTNFLKLLRGRGLGAVLTVSATALAARTLPATDFGLVVLIHGYLLVMHGLFKLKPGDAVVHYGVPAQEMGDDAGLLQMLRMTLALDLATAAASVVIAVALVPLLGPYLQWETATRDFVQCYSLLLVAGIGGTPGGILRLFNRYDLLAWRQVAGPAVLLTGISLAALFEQGVTAYAAAFGASWLVRHLYVTAQGLRVLRHHIPGALAPGPLYSDLQRRFPGFWRFIHVIYWQSNLDLVPKHISVLLVGFMLGPTEAGLFRLAERFSKLLAVPALLLRQVLFPDLARLWHHAAPSFGRVVARTLGTALAFGLGVALLMRVIGGPLLEAAVGSEYLAAAPVLAWLMLAAGLELGVSTVRAAAYAQGLAGRVLRYYALSLGLYLMVLLAMTPLTGLTAAGMAAAAAALANLAAISWRVRRRIAQAPG